MARLTCILFWLTRYISQMPEDDVVFVFCFKTGRINQQHDQQRYLENGVKSQRKSRLCTIIDQ